VHLVAGTVINVALVNALGVAARVAGLPEVLDYDVIGGIGLKGALFNKGFPRMTGLSTTRERCVCLL